MFDERDLWILDHDKGRGVSYWENCAEEPFGSCVGQGKACIGVDKTC